MLTQLWHTEQICSAEGGTLVNSVYMWAQRARWSWCWWALRGQWTYIQAGFVRPPQQCQASHILCKYALLRSFAGAFSPVRSPQILISQVTVVGFKPVCAADITIQASQINLGGPFLCISCSRRVPFATSSLTFYITVVIKFPVWLDFLNVSIVLLLLLKTRQCNFKCLCNLRHEGRITLSYYVCKTVKRTFGFCLQIENPESF